MMGSLFDQFRVSYLLQALKRRGRLLSELHFTRIRDITIASLSEPDPNQIFCRHGAGSSALKPEVATLKCLSEFFERTAFHELCDRGEIPSDGSTGFAAFPWILHRKAFVRKAARMNALAEAVERYVWDYWWRHPDVRFSLEYIDPKTIPLSAPEYSWVQLLTSELGMHRLGMIFPEIEKSEFKVIIAFGETAESGVVGGGACSTDANAASAIFRAFSELFMHASAVRRAREQMIEPVDMYQERLLFFAEKAGEEIFRERIGLKGGQPVLLPKIAVDEAVIFSLGDIGYIHRILFEGQLDIMRGGREMFVY